jgi:hypothetical protein
MVAEDAVIGVAETSVPLVARACPQALKRASITPVRRIIELLMSDVTAGPLEGY